MEVTSATMSDIPELAALLSLLFSQETEFTPDFATQLQGLAHIISDPAIGHILVVREEGQILAMVNLLYSVSTALGGKVCIVEDMVVRPESRRRGIGSVLLSHAIEYAKRVGCLRMTLLTDAQNSSAQRFYQNLGFVQSNMIPMRLFIGD